MEWEIIEKKDGITLWRGKVMGYDYEFKYSVNEKGNVRIEKVTKDNKILRKYLYATSDERPWYGYSSKKLALTFPNAFSQRLWHGGLRSIDDPSPVVYTFRNRLPANVNKSRIREILLENGAPEWVKDGIFIEKRENGIDIVGIIKKGE